GAAIVNNINDDIEESLLYHYVVNERMIAWQNAIEQETANRGFKQFAFKLTVFWRVGCQYFDLGTEADQTIIVGVDCVIWRSKEFSFTLVSLDDLGHPVSAERHIEQFF